MKKRVFCIFIFVFQIIFFGCHNSASHFDLSKDERRTLALAAVRGNGDAAYRLGDYFAFTKLDYKNMIIWHTIGAENGHVNATHSLSNILTRNENDEKTFLRGIFWRYKLAILGHVINEAWTSEDDLLYHGYTLETAKPPSDSLYPSNPSLSEDEVERYKDGALRGSGKAALVFSNFYKNIADMESAEYWYQIGAQNGNVECMKQYGTILAGKEEMLDQERGKFWLQRANAGG